MCVWLCRDGIPVLKRFSGGGTVIVDHNTVFTTFICNVVRADTNALVKVASLILQYSNNCALSIAYRIHSRT